MRNFEKDVKSRGFSNKKRIIVHANGNEYDLNTGAFLGGINPPDRRNEPINFSANAYNKEVSKRQKGLYKKRDLKGYEKW